MSSPKIAFEPASATVETARRIVFARLRAEREWNHLDPTGEGFAPFTEYLSWPRPQDGRHRLAFLAQDVFWQLVGEGVLSPGKDLSNLSLPFFHVTAYGVQVLSTEAPEPHDPTGYLAAIQGKIMNPDQTVMAYLAESLGTFRTGNLVASTVMLGIAAERVFLLLCDAIEPALADPKEQAEFRRLRGFFAMKPKLDWVNEKLQRVQKQRLPGFPENASIMTVVIYDLLRTQRNELGHPREYTPNVTRADTFANLQVFARYFELASQVCTLLKSTHI